MRGIHEPGRTRITRLLERKLPQLRGVDWATVNQITGRVVVAFDGDQVSLEDITGVVEAVEESEGLADEPFPSDRPEHPSD